MVISDCIREKERVMVMVMMEDVNMEKRMTCEVARNMNWRRSEEVKSTRELMCCLALFLAGLR